MTPRHAESAFPVASQIKVHGKGITVFQHFVLELHKSCLGGWYAFGSKGDRPKVKDSIKEAEKLFEAMAEAEAS